MLIDVSDVDECSQRQYEGTVALETVLKVPCHTRNIHFRSFLNR